MSLLFLGTTNFRNKFIKFGIREIDRMRHMTILGSTGVGKSTLLENMIIQDMQAGRGVCVIDPHGDLAEKILHSVPKRRTNDVVYFNPADIRYPVSFNPIESVPENQVHIVVSGMMSVFEKLFFGGSNFASQAPQLTYILRNALFAIMDYKASNLLNLKRMLVDEDFRKDVISHIKDEEIRSFWTKEFPERIMKRRDDPLASTLNKLGQFLTAKMLRNIMGQTKSKVNLREIMDNRKIVIANLSKGHIGHDISSMLGTMLITKLYLDSMSRVNIPENERQPFFVYVDEFQNFANEAFSHILSESRKYRLGLTMANQYIKQLPEPIRDSVFGNCGTILNFKCGVEDAQYFEILYDKIFDVSDMVSLPKYHCYLKLQIDGMSSLPFSATTLPPIITEESNALNIIKQSRLRYASKLK